jgi:hypothetical protein
VPGWVSHLAISLSEAWVGWSHKKRFDLLIEAVARLHQPATWRGHPQPKIKMHVRHEVGCPM